MATSRGRNLDIPGSSSASFAQAPQVPAKGDFPPLVRSGAFRDLSGRFVGGMSMAWKGLPILVALPHTVQKDLREARDRALPKLQEDMVAYAKENAPWRDVTGDARAELHSPPITENANGDKSVILAHGVDYGVHLETRDGGATGIIGPTIETFAQQLHDRIAAEVRK